MIIRCGASMCMVPPSRDALFRGHLLIRIPRAILLAFGLALVSGLAGARLASGSWMVPPAPDRPKDFALVKRDGLYHLFYIRNNPNLPFEDTQYDFGHAVSEDLYFWQHRPPVLGRRPGMFDRTHVWAPSIVLRDGVYYMFYTGVSDTGAVHHLYQRTGIATSTDLDHWNALEAPVFDCLQAPWTPQDSIGASAFRDPFVMADPATPGGWLMYYSTQLPDQPGMIVGAARSAGDFTSWQDAGPLWITHRSYSYNDVVESPHLFQHNGLWFLFFSTTSGQPISYATGTDPLAGPQGWVYRGRLANMLGVNTAAWFASEYLRDGLVEYFSFVNGDRVEVVRMVWTAPDRFSLTQPDLFHVKSLNWISPTVRAGTQTTLYIQSKWGTGKTAYIECHWVDSLGVSHPVPNAALGLPDGIPITADLQAFNWLARSLPPEYNAPEAPTIVVRLIDQTATANPLQLLPQTGSGEPDPPPDPAGYPSGGSEELYERGAFPQLRTLRNTIYGSLPSLLVDFAAGERARIDLFDLQGRRVRALADRHFERGATVVTWDGRDESGQRASSGLYFARLTTAGATRTARVLLR